MSSPSSTTIDYSDDRPWIYLVSVSFAFIATLSVALRFWARKLIHQSWKTDDYLALLALSLAHGTAAAAFTSVELGGLGRDTALFTMRHPGATVYFYKSVFAIDVLYALSSPIIKLSVLAFYWRVFPTRTMKVACIILASLCVVWAIVVGVINFLICQPLEAFWNIELQMSPGTKCLNIISYWLGNSISNCIIDFATLVLPIHEVAKLQTSVSKKIGICAVFLLGGVAFAASLTRTITAGQLPYVGVSNPNKQLIIPGCATVVEVYVAVIGACLPTLIPVYRKLRHGNALRSAKASHSDDKPIISIKTIGRIPYRGQQFTRGRSSFETLQSVESSRSFDPQNARQTNMRGTVEYELSKNTPLETVSSQGTGVTHDMAWSDDDRSTV
ncbi:hypothetical protein F5Y07DRAFT_321965 [Xylaria sp. FL0933]|nr:hypothetical protein F5Y07DRAFT_321965 [Xylaria sp. FL0933]